MMGCEVCGDGVYEDCAFVTFVFFFSSRRRHTRCSGVSWAREMCIRDSSIRAESWYPAPAGPENCHGARRVWRTFCRPDTEFSEHYACRATSLIGAPNFSPVTNLAAGTGAVSRYKPDRSQKTVKV